MAEREQTAPGLTRRAMQAANDGETGDARRLLAEALHLDPSYEPAWLWFASVADGDAERRFCLDKAVEASPRSTARTALKTMRTVEAAAPPELEDLLDPPAPPDVMHAPKPPSRSWLVGVGLGLLVAALVAAVVLIRRDDSKSPVYLGFVMGISGPDARAVQQMRDGAKLFLDELNRDGGVDGHPVKLIEKDDEDDPDLARQRAEEIVQDDRVLAVIGHSTSGTSLAAQPVYEEADMPVITPTSTADALTAGTPWTFSAVFTNSTQGRFIARYLQEQFAETSLTLVTGSDNYSTTLATGVTGTFPADGGSFGLDTAEGRTPPAEEVDALADAVAAAAPTGSIVLALPESTAVDVVGALRERGIHNRLIGGDVIGNDAFYQELLQIGVEGKRVFATAPMINDSVSGDAVRWMIDFSDEFGYPPTWEAATTDDALTALVHGMRSDGMTFDEDDVADDRLRIRDALAAIDDPDKALNGLMGPLWFGPEGDAVRPVIVGHGEENLLVSAPEQLQPYVPVNPVLTQRASDTGEVVQVADGEYYRRRRIVTIGVNINEISELDSQNQTFKADFFLWVRFTGSDDAANLWFPNATDSGLDLGDPVRDETDEDGLSYRLYRVHSTFVTDLDFKDFPFDEQNLAIEVQHRTLPASLLTFSEDVEVSNQTQKERLSSGTEQGVPLHALNGWTARQLLFFQTTIGSDAALGDPEIANGLGGLSYARFVTDITVGREVSSFLVKNLLPLILLGAATYVSLFFSHSQTGTRVSFGITGILTGAVLLSDVTKSLPNVGYTVAIEWAYYAFILLSVACVLVGLVGDRLYEQRRLAAIRRLDLASRIGYPLVCLIIVGIYFVNFR